MNVSSILKSPSAMGGAGIVGSGGIGVGGWQIYEEVNPSTHRQLSKQGYTWSPAEVPLNDTVPVSDNKKFEWKNWDSCTKKLFPNLTIKNEETNESTTVTYVKQIDDETAVEVSDPKPKKDIYLTTPITVTDNLVACALFDLRGNSDGSKHKIYFKSEVAVKDTNHGWIMWSGLSNVPSNNKGSVTLEHRLLTLKKNNTNWEIDKGFGWSSAAVNGSASNEVLDQLHIVLPKGHYWNTTGKNIGTGYSKREIWSGIATVDKSSNQHLVESLNIHLEKKGDAETESDRSKLYGFWGVEGKWTESKAGYDKANKVYDSSVGWKTISTPINLQDTLNEWYKPYMGDNNYNNAPNVRWTTCDSWAGARGKSQNNTSEVYKAIKDICYSSSGA